MDDYNNIKWARCEQLPKEDKSTTYRGVYRGIAFKIHRWNFEGKTTDNWNYYIIINLTKQLDFELAKKFWLKGKRDSFGHINYRYLESKIINALRFHGGCTYYEKLSGFDGNDKIVEIGCDYLHYNDEGKFYDVNLIYSETKETIDSLYKLAENKVNVGSNGDGRWQLIEKYDTEETKEN